MFSDVVVSALDIRQWRIPASRLIDKFTKLRVGSGLINDWR
jgi:hypothetical protein